MKKSAVPSLTASRSLAKHCRGMMLKGVVAEEDEVEGEESHLWVSARTKPIT